MRAVVPSIGILRTDTSPSISPAVGSLLFPKFCQAIST